jgi:hypothetical protein
MHRTYWRRFRLLIGMTAMLALGPQMKCIDTPPDDGQAVAIRSQTELAT